MLKKFLFLSLLTICASLRAVDNYECKDDYNNDDLEQIIAKHLKEAGIDGELCFCGDLDFTATFLNQKENASKNGTVMSMQGNVDLKYLQKQDSYGLGFEIGVKTRSGVIKQGRAILNSSFLFMEFDEIGLIKFGYTNTAADALNIGGDKFLVGYQGAGSGNFGVFYNASAGSIIGTGFPFDDDKAVKIAWLSPTVSGFSAGLSFTPDSRDSNLFKTKHNKIEDNLIGKEDFAHSSAYSQNIITGGVAYEFGDPDDFNAKFSVTGWCGKGKSNCHDIEVQNLRAYNVGAILGYKDLKISCGYTDNGRSFLAKKPATQDIAGFNPNRHYDINDPDVGIKDGANAGKIYSLGVAYTFNKLTVSVGYFYSVVKFSADETAHADIITLASEYKFNKLFSIYAEYDNIRTNTCDRALAYASACDQPTVGKNRANVLMIGTKLNF